MIAAPIAILIMRYLRLLFSALIPLTILSAPRTMRPVPAKKNKAVSPICGEKTIQIDNEMHTIPTAIWIGQNHRRVVIGASNLFISLNYPATVMLFSGCYILFHEDNVDLTASSSFLPDIPVTTSLMPYTKSGIPITKAASAIPNSGDPIIIIDKAMANAPAPMANALEPVLAVVRLYHFVSPRSFLLSN